MASHSTITHLRWLGFAEAISWFFLIMAMLLKYIWNKPLMVTYVGWVHGLLFILYCIHLVLAYRLLKWSFSKLAAGGVAAFLPFGTLWFDGKINTDPNKNTSY